MFTIEFQLPITKIDLKESVNRLKDSKYFYKGELAFVSGIYVDTTNWMNIIGFENAVALYTWWIKSFDIITSDDEDCYDIIQILYDQMSALSFGIANFLVRKDIEKVPHHEFHEHMVLPYDLNIQVPELNCSLPIKYYSGHEIDEIGIWKLNTNRNDIVVYDAEGKIISRILSLRSFFAPKNTHVMRILS